MADLQKLCVVEFLEIGHELPLDFLGSRHCRPLNSRTASNIATTFSVGVPAWMLSIALKTKPPPGAKISHRRSTYSRTSAGVPKGKVFCVSTPPPQKVKRSPYSCLSRSGSIPTAEHCTGLTISKPASMNDS